MGSDMASVDMHVSDHTSDLCVLKPGDFFFFNLFIQWLGNGNLKITVALKSTCLFGKTGLFFKK